VLCQRLLERAASGFPSGDKENPESSSLSPAQKKMLSLGRGVDRRFGDAWSCLDYRGWRNSSGPREELDRYWAEAAGAQRLCCLGTAIWRCGALSEGRRICGRCWRVVSMLSKLCWLRFIQKRNLQDITKLPMARPRAGRSDRGLDRVRVFVDSRGTLFSGSGCSWQVWA